MKGHGTLARALPRAASRQALHRTAFLCLIAAILTFSTQCVALDGTQASQHSMEGPQQWAVHLVDDAGTPLGKEAADAVAASRNFRNVGPVGELEGYWLFEPLDGNSETGPGLSEAGVSRRRLKKRTSDELSLDLSGHTQIRWHEEQRILKRSTRSIPVFEDPLFGDQWHLVSCQILAPFRQHC